MTVFLASFRTEIKSSLRDRNPQIIILIFLILTSVSTLIGWLTVRNVSKIFFDIKSLGLTKSPNPFIGIPTLYYVRNSVIYLILVGSLMALILGVQSSLRDRQSETSVLIKSRNVSLRTRYLGQITALSTILLWTELFVLVTTYLSLWLIRSKPMEFNQLLRLLIFILISWLLLCSLAATGMIFGALATSEENAFLNPFICWSIVIFIVPLVVTGVRPIALLNPTPALSQSSGIPDLIHNLLNPVMIMEHFKAISNQILGVDPTQSMTVMDLLYFGFPIAMALIAPLLFARKSLGMKLDA